MVVDYADSFEYAIAAQGKGRNVLILSKLDEPKKRFDGKMAHYELEHRWLSETCEDERDQAWACVQGQDFTFWQHKEIKQALKSDNLFEHFDLF
jgi:hypothetical protein